MVPEELQCTHHILALAEAPFGEATHLKFKWNFHLNSLKGTRCVYQYHAKDNSGYTFNWDHLCPTLGIATPQNPMPAPMDRLSENIAIEAIACQENLLFTVDVNYSISYFCLLEEHTEFVNSCKICKFM